VRSCACACCISVASSSSNIRYPPVRGLLPKDNSLHEHPGFWKSARSLFNDMEPNVKIRLLTVVIALLTLTGCAAFNRMFCASNCSTEQESTSNLVEFLYPDGGTPPTENALPELRLPLRVGLAFLPTRSNAANSGLDAARKEQLLELIRSRFADRSFVASITVIPEYYLADRRGFGGLEGIQRLYGVDVMALISYDQEAHLDNNEWSLSYLTIVGAYVVKGNRHDISTLVDLAVVDPVTRSLVLRAGGIDTRSGNTTLLEHRRESREASGAGFEAATDRMIENFDAALKKFQEEVRAGNAPVRIVRRNSARTASTGGGGALDWWSLAILAGFCLVRRLPRTVRAR
jgi:rhombotail lipoprotein